MHRALAIDQKKKEMLRERNEWKEMKKNVCTENTKLVKINHKSLDIFTHVSYFLFNLQIHLLQADQSLIDQVRILRILQKLSNNIKHTKTSLQQS